MRKVFRYIVPGLSTLILCFSLLILTLVLVQRIRGETTPMLFNTGIATVRTGSMEPSVPTGSLILFRKANSYFPNDIVVYKDPSGLAITHRIQTIEHGIVVAKGDANNTADAPFKEDLILGRVDLVLPFWGQFFAFLQHPVFLITCAALFCLIIVLYLIKPIKKGNGVPYEQ